MKQWSNIIPVILVVVVLGALAYWKLNEDVEQFEETEKLPVDKKEYVWVRADSLSAALTKYSRGNIEIDSSFLRGYTISYSSKKYLFHEKIEYADSLRKHLTSDENVGCLKKYRDTDDLVQITLKRKDGYVFCPAMIVAWVLREKYEDDSRRH